MTDKKHYEASLTETEELKKEINQLKKELEESKSLYDVLWNATRKPYQELITENKDLKSELEKYQWISVKDRLPEYGTRALVYNTIWEIKVVCGIFCHSRRGHFWKDIRESQIHYVTHWRPLPDRPQTSTEEDKPNE